MEKIDQKFKLLEKLYLNSRIHTIKLAQDLELSRQTISKFLRQLWEKRIIHSPTILLNPHVLNLQYFFMEIKTNPSEQKLLNELNKMKEIVTIDGILGDYALLLKFEVQTKKQFADLLKEIDQNISETFFSSYRIIECIDIFKIGGFILETDHPVKPLEEKDKKWEILQLLKQNHNIRRWSDEVMENKFSKEDRDRLSTINLSREFSYYDDNKMIAQYTVTYDIDKMLMFLKETDTSIKDTDFGTKFYLQIKPKRLSDYTELATRLKFLPQIIDLYRTGSESGLLAIVRTRGLKEFNSFIQSLYQSYPIRDTLTTVVVEEQIPSIFPPTLEIAEKMCREAEKNAKIRS
ncbi:MAG: Lrp/AsnC ligand binding domain-containing protein [Promethearchaeota archaeon]